MSLQKNTPENEPYAAFWENLNTKGIWGFSETDLDEMLREIGITPTEAIACEEPIWRALRSAATVADKGIVPSVIFKLHYSNRRAFLGITSKEPDNLTSNWLWGEIAPLHQGVEALEGWNIQEFTDSFLSNELLSIIQSLDAEHLNSVFSLPEDERRTALTYTLWAFMTYAEFLTHQDPSTRFIKDIVGHNIFSPDEILNALDYILRCEKYRNFTNLYGHYYDAARIYDSLNTITSKTLNRAASDYEKLSRKSDKETLHWLYLINVEKSDFIQHLNTSKGRSDKACLLILNRLNLTPFEILSTDAHQLNGLGKAKLIALIN